MARLKRKDPLPLSKLSQQALNTIWLTVSEAAKLGGVTTKTIRRGIQAQILRYKIVSNRYFVDFASLIRFLYSRTKLRNKLNQQGIGQYVKKWEK